MALLNSDELFQVLVDCAGEGEAKMTDDALDTPFDDLGYDSLALMEAAARIKQHTGVQIDDEKITELATPRDMLDAINGVTVEV
jgi:act minimal PKS acyl carrier protein